MAKKQTAAARRHATATPTEPESVPDDALHSATEQVESAREQLRAAEAILEEVRDKAAKRVAWLRDKSTGELLDTSLDLVRKHPGLGVLAAASVGYFLGRLFRR